jgi:putative nucleotidyltransferase with HDIG domain
MLIPMGMGTKIAVLGSQAKAPQDVAQLAKHLHKLDCLAFEQLRSIEELDADVIVVDLEALPLEELQAISPTIRQLKRPDQPMILISARSQIAGLSAVELLQGNNAVSRPLDSDNFTNLVDSLITLQRSRQKSGIADLAARIAAPSSPITIEEPQEPAPEAIVEEVVAAAPPVSPAAEDLKEASAPSPKIEALAIARRIIEHERALESGLIAPRAKSVLDDAATQTTVEAARALSQVLSRVFAIASDDPAITQDELGTVTDIVAHAIERHGLAAFVRTVQSHHSGTYQHCLLVAGTTVACAKHFSFSDRDLRRVTAAALVHDVGKVAVPLDILDKPSKLTAQEFEIIKSHTTIGHEMMRKIDGFDAEMADMVLSHHEYLDGSGYPNGLSASQISDLVRIITIADVYSALVEQRAYKRALTGKQAYDILESMHGKLDMPLVRAQHSILMTD